MDLSINKLYVSFTYDRKVVTRSFRPATMRGETLSFTTLFRLRDSEVVTTSYTGWFGSRWLSQSVDYITKKLNLERFDETRVHLSMRMEVDKKAGTVKAETDYIETSPENNRIKSVKLIGYDLEARRVNKNTRK